MQTVENESEVDRIERLFAKANVYQMARVRPYPAGPAELTFEYKKQVVARYLEQVANGELPE